jgi:hypothetical protein
MSINLKNKIKTLKHQIQACLKLIAKKIKMYVDRLVCLETELEKLESMETPFPVTEDEVKEAFVAIGGCLKRYWKSEMATIIPRLIGKNIPISAWDWMVQFPEVQEMERLGWRDRHIKYCIEAADWLFRQRQKPRRFTQLSLF